MGFASFGASQYASFSVESFFTRRSSWRLFGPWQSLTPTGGGNVARTILSKRPPVSLFGTYAGDLDFSEHDFSPSFAWILCPPRGDWGLGIATRGSLSENLALDVDHRKSAPRILPLILRAILCWRKSICTGLKQRHIFLALLFEDLYIPGHRIAK